MKHYLIFIVLIFCQNSFSQSGKITMQGLKEFIEKKEEYESNYWYTENYDSLFYKADTIYLYELYVHYPIKIKVLDFIINKKVNIYDGVASAYGVSQIDITQYKRFKLKLREKNGEVYLQFRKLFKNVHEFRVIGLDSVSDNRKKIFLERIKKAAP